MRFATRSSRTFILLASLLFLFAFPFTSANADNTEPSAVSSAQSASASASVPASTSDASSGNDVRPANVLPADAVPLGGYLSPQEFYQSLTFMIFGVVILLIEFVLLWRASATAEQVLKVFGITLIIVGALVSISSGFNTQQIATAMGLFGTLAGYLLGKRDEKEEKK